MKSKITLIAALLAAHAGSSIAAVSADEAKKLGTTLTGIGAEKAGNKEGTIPEYKGGLTTPPAGYKKGDGIRPDPFASEKPLFSIDAKNMDKYADKLTEGVKTLMKKYPTYRIDVYPTQRTAAYPKYIIDNTAGCAVTAKTKAGGISMEGCHAGIPFPIPKTGNEAMWNHLMRFRGTALQQKFAAWNVDASGRPTLSTEGAVYQDFPYWDNSKKSSDLLFMLKIIYTGPPRRAGEALMVHDPLDFADKGRRAWQYLPGQRRVKLAPDVAFDTPNPGTAGASTYDDAYVFNGSMERFNFKLVGKKEMYVPYNNYRMAYHSKAVDLLKPNHLNPDLVRWELHRVWVVEATLMEGKRHVYNKRLFYLDEDSWLALSSDQYDARGQIYRSGFNYVVPSYEIPAPFADLQGHYDFIGGLYTTNGYTAEVGGVRHGPMQPEREMSPEALGGSGIR
jgi:hypothetical protein